ncbi:uncharacterized protein C13orf42 homolog [Danio rerio]|uniref:Uncharacterized protein C13orf42 homolog n=1 Tax=Danio rerio TaxID=7955 RepID=A0AC58GGV9_DANRE|nr:uncharacterized protein LOC110438837 isoform X1 [Danio rerio]XP_021334655.1 uncharacterized protein LOC110438837 isoform X1 [Danio rerio]|eukprot:XP_021327874.1 uncharacterized protein LOC110438837 isoform X1 [Danio rerio]
MFKKINAVFRPNHPAPRSRDRFRSTEDYHSACTVKLVRSTSMLVVGESSRALRDSTLKRSVSAVSVESSTALYYYQSREDRVWLYSQNQDCLEYLQELVALRRQYTKSINDLKDGERKETASRKKNAAPRPPQSSAPQTSRPVPSAPPMPNEEDTLQFFDEVIASCDPEPSRKPHVDNGHADVDFIVATSTSEHDLHSNWVLRDPRRISMLESQPKKINISHGKAAQRKGDMGSTGSRRCLQRNPIHLPKVVESAFQTLRFKPKLKKKD